MHCFMCKYNGVCADLCQATPRAGQGAYDVPKCHIADLQLQQLQYSRKADGLNITCNLLSMHDVVQRKPLQATQCMQRATAGFAPAVVWCVGKL